MTTAGVWDAMVQSRQLTAICFDERPSPEGSDRESSFGGIFADRGAPLLAYPQR